VCFGGDIRARQLERSIGGLQSQVYCVERLSLLNVEAIEIFHAGALQPPFTISKEASSKDYVCLCSVDLARVSNRLQCLVLLHDKLFSSSMTMLFDYSYKLRFSYMPCILNLCAVISYFTGKALGI